MAERSAPVLAFGPFLRYRAQRRLREDGQPMRQGTRAMDLLIALVEQDGQVLSRGELMGRMWPREVMEDNWLLHDRRPDFIAEDIDCAIQVGEVTDHSVVAIKLSEVPRIVVAAPSVVGQTTPSHPAELAQRPWLSLRTFYRNEIQLTPASGGNPCRVAIGPRLGTDSLCALRTAAVSGLGVCAASAWLLQEDLAEGRLVHLVPDWVPEPLPVYLVYPHARFCPAKLKRFIDIMREAVASSVAGLCNTRPRAR